MEGKLDPITIFLREHTPAKYLSDKFGDWLIDQTTDLIQAFIQGLPEMVSLGLVFCALAMMFTGSTHKWAGRAFMILWVGITLIML